MTKKEVDKKISDNELPDKAQKHKKDAIATAFFIGLCVGVILWSVVKNTWGLLTLIPIYMIYRMIKKPSVS